MRSFDEKAYISDTCHKHLCRNEMPWQVVLYKMNLDLIPNKLKDLKKNKKKKLISKRTMFKRKAIMHGKGGFAKIKGSISNIPIKRANIYNILPRPAESNGLIVVKLK